MAKEWYILHTYTGYENKIERQIRLLLQDEPFYSTISDVRVPTEEVVEIKNGKKKTVQKKFLPGYVLLEMDLPHSGWQIVCTPIRRINGVTGFLGVREGSRPTPITQEEAREMLNRGAGKGDRARVNRSYAIDETIRIIDGPFESFTGTVTEINLERAKLKVMVGIFGRSTPVELDFAQVEKI